MKKIVLFFLFSLLIFSSKAQKVQFDRIPGTLPILPLVADIDAARGNSAVGDIDNDGDIDIIIAGAGLYNDPHTQIYLNDGAGSYYESYSQKLDSLGGGGLELFDSDGDGDLDLLIVGTTNYINFYRSSFYKNDGSGNFTLQLNSNIIGVRNSNINVFDSDGDGDLDLLITGQKSNNDYEANLYLNNGTGIYSLSTGHPFSAVEGSMTEVADVNGDGKIDVIMRIEGFNASSTFTRLYLNLGTQYIENPLVLFNSNSGAFKFADVDNDGDEDVLFLNYVHNQVNTSQLYLNNGSGNFTLSTTGVMGLYLEDNKSINFFDYDNDNDLDLIISGFVQSSDDTTILYQNNSGVFTALGPRGIDLGFYAHQFIALDFDNDGLKDMLGLTLRYGSPRKTVLYKNLSSGQFREVTGNSLLGLGYGGVKFGDIDNDGDEDIISHGYVDYYNSATKIYINDGNGAFLESTFQLPYITDGSLELADLDSDGDLDIAMVGKESAYNSSRYRGIAGVYLNNGSGQFSILNSITLLKYTNPKLITGDFDNDGNIDIAHFGSDASNNGHADLYMNNGSASFTINSNSGISLSQVKDLKVADFDNDGDLDFFIAGYRYPTKPNNYVDLFLNDGTGNFSAKGGVGFSNSRVADIGVGDINQDGFLDAIVVGSDSSTFLLTQVGINDGTGNFVLNTAHNLPMLSEGQVEFADIDSDNKIDLFIQGAGSRAGGPSLLESNFYINLGNGKFKKNIDSTIVKANDGMIAFADIDNDNDLDFAQFGISQEFKPLGRLYKNRCGSYRDTTIISGCKNYLWRGKQINFSGEYFDTITNSNGCDSLYVLYYADLSNESKDTVESCKPYTLSSGAIVTASGTYIDSLFNTNNCDSVVERYITIHPNIYTKDSIEVCNLNFYIWNGDSIYNSGNYIDTLQTVSGCDSVIELDLNIVRNEKQYSVDIICSEYIWGVNNKTYYISGVYLDTLKQSGTCDSIFELDLNLTTFDTSIVKTRFDLFSNQSNVSYQWVDCSNGDTLIAGATSQTYTAIKNGTYSVILSNNNCSDTSRCIRVIGVGISEINVDTDLLLYPNPTTNTLNIKGLEEGKFAYKIFDVTGREIERATQNSTQEIDIANFVKGTYFISIQQKLLIQNFTFIKL